MRKPEEIANAFSQTDSLNGVDGFFLTGIGGAGMSALARMLSVRGYRVRGTDSTASAEVDRLRSEGIECIVGHTGEPIELSDALILSDAIDLESSPEVARAKDLGIPILRRSQALGWILRGYKTIAVTGTHGKTTTTGMLGAALISAGLDPLVVVGAAIPQWGGPIREGKGEYAVVEACEAYDSFHDLEPQIVVLTNLELDHKDFHVTYERLRSSVVRFVDSMSEDGWLVYCSEDRGASEVAELTSARAFPYGIGSAWTRQILNKIGWEGESIRPLQENSELRLPGRHNLLNAAGALAAAAVVHADLDKAEAALKEFGGAERRLQEIQGSPILVFDDYAHHPSEIVASLTALRARHFGGSESGKLIVVFQPHLYSRTSGQYQEFAEALSLADEVFLTDIYPAREAPMPGVSSARIAELITKPVHYVPNRKLLPREVANLAQDGDVVVGMGAGTIGEFAKSFVDELERRRTLQSGLRSLRVAIFYGGDSAEREVSLHGGLAAKAAFDRLGYEAKLYDPSELLLRGASFEEFIGPKRPDIAFLVMHGTHAEDGAIQGLLELLHIPYTGSGIQASAICMDKALTKTILGAKGVRTPRGVVLSSPDDEVTLDAPLIVKPNAQGSTVGLSFVEDRKDLFSAVHKAFAYDSQVLVEEWIQGVEISVPVLNGRALAPVEIAPKTGRYDFQSKYEPGATEEIIPARLPEEVLERAKETALLAHRTLNCKGATRMDALVRGDEIFVLEVNTLPGLTPTSLLPNSAAYEGLSFEQLCKTIVEGALGAQKDEAATG